MFVVYLIALALGGTFVVASLLFGGDGDLDMDADADLDMELDADADAEVDADADADADSAHGGLAIGGVLAWLPITSLRFWTFFLAFFGLTGTVLSAFELLADPLAIAVIASCLGYATGWTTVAVIRHLTRNQHSSTVSASDYVGASGTVMVPVERGQIGKVRLEVKGRVIDLLARTEDVTRLECKAAVMVYGQDDDHILVTRAA
ncbi:MAG: hypothetical protein AAGC55_09420 [Myxococcota bacterium]